MNLKRLVEANPDAAGWLLEQNVDGPFLQGAKSKDRTSDTINLLDMALTPFEQSA